MADDRDPKPQADSPGTRVAPSGPIQQISEEHATQAPGAPEPPKFTTEAHWDTAGYNNQEIVYTILITNQDSRIIHCSTLMQGFYLEKGQKVSISDRQNSTIFPGQQGKAGNWLGMDKDSGATYKVTCHPR
jgi:hypothetical protein